MTAWNPAAAKCCLCSTTSKTVIRVNLDHIEEKGLNKTDCGNSLRV